MELVKTSLPSGPFVCPELGQIRLDMRGASPRSSASQGYFRHALVAKCTNRFASEEGFRHALVAKCTSKFASEEGFRLTLWQAAQASSRPKSVSDVRLWRVAQASSCLRTVSDVRLWRMHKQVLVGAVHALRQSCERFPRGTLEKLSRQHLSENQPEYDWKAAGARQHLSDDTDVDQCAGCTVELLYVVRFQVGRLYAQCWTCLNV